MVVLFEFAANEKFVLPNRSRGSLTQVAGVFSLLVALAVSLIVNRIATMALMFTGLSREAAKFQARSAFSGVGYTTTEAENVVNHPVRRQIVMILMLLGNIGIATVIATVMLSVSSTTNASWQQQVTMMASLSLGLLLLWMVFSSRAVERQMNKAIAWSLKRFTDLDARDYVSLLQLADGYAVSEMVVDKRHWIAGGVLKELRLSDEGILILGIRRSDGAYQGIPCANDMIEPSDTLILYGNIEQIRALDRRKVGASGDKQHLASVQRQEALEDCDSETDSSKSDGQEKQQ